MLNTPHRLRRHPYDSVSLAFFCGIANFSSVCLELWNFQYKNLEIVWKSV